MPRPLATLDSAHHCCPLPRLVYPLAFLGHPPRSCDGRAKGARLLPPSLGTAHPRGVQLGWHRPSVILAPSLRLACGHAREKSLDRVLPGSFSRAAAHELVPTPPSPLLESPCPTPPPQFSSSFVLYSATPLPPPTPESLFSLPPCTSLTILRGRAGGCRRGAHLFRGFAGGTAVLSVWGNTSHLDVCGLVMQRAFDSRLLWQCVVLFPFMSF